MRKIGKAVTAIASLAVSVLVAIMTAAWLALAFVAPIAGLKFCILYLL